MLPAVVSSARSSAGSAAIRSLMEVLIEAVITVPSTAVPRVEPMLRKNWIAAVAVPSSRRATAFCTTSVYTCIDMPSPRPITIIVAVRCHCVSPYSRPASIP